MPYWRMRGDWHRLAEKAVKTDSSWQGCCATVRAAGACFMVVLCCHSCRVQYTGNTPTLPRMQIFSPLGDGDEMATHQDQQHVIKERKQVRIHMCSVGVGVRAKLSYFGEKVGA